jgi:RHS repeat-associated protein
VTDPTGAYSMAYDNMGRLIGTTTQYSFLTGHTFTNSYAYDAASNRTSLTLPDLSSDTYAYDTLNRLKSITDSLTGQFNFGYDALSRRTSLTRPNGVNTGYSYDSLSRLLSVLHQSGTTTLDGASYTYDAAGNPTTKTNQLNNITEQYTYDPLYQLTKVTQGTTTTESYNYDSVGNRLSSLAVASYSYNPSNELTANSAGTFTYDSNGNMLTKTDSTGTRNYTWDFENRLSSVVLPGSGGTVTFKYDPFGRRIQKAFTQNSTTTATNYVYDGNDLTEEVDASGNELAHYAKGVGIDEPLAQLRSGTMSFYQQDGLDSVTSLTSTTGTMANTYTYDSFGNLIATTGALMNAFQYTARDYDPETGLRYHRARYYDPAVGRFLSEDPIGFNGGINFYSYVANDPVNFMDQGGLAMTPAQCKELLDSIVRRAEKLELKIKKYNPITDGQSGHPYSAGGQLKYTKQPGIHYDIIISRQVKLWVDIARYQRECTNGPRCPQRVFEIVGQKIPQPVIPTSPFSDWLEDQKWELEWRWREFMNPNNPPWWFWFNPRKPQTSN